MMAGVTTVYTDGACSGNPGPGGWAWVVPDGPFAAGGSPDTTNQRMELTAALEAVRAIDGPLEVVSDSTYVVNCFRDKWWEGWLRRGWKNSKKEPVANRDLWEPLIEQVRARGDEVGFRWVKGHAGDRWNDLADRLAVEAAATQLPRRGDSPPQAVGAPDRPRSPVAAPASEPTGRGRPAGHLVVVGGDRSRRGAVLERHESGVRRRLAEILGAKARLHPDLVVLAGLRQGAESLAAEAAADAGVPWVAVLPYPDPDTRWSEAARRRFAELVEGADEVITLQSKVPDSTASARGALDRRDAWFARNAHEAVVVWDGDDDETAQLVKRLEGALGDEVWVVDPREV